VATPVSSAPKDIISIRMESAVKSRETASNSTSNRASAKNVMKDTQSSMDSARSSTRPSPATSAVPSGPQASARHAPRDGSSMLTTSAPPSVTSAPPGTTSPETARPATTDPLSNKDSVSPIPIPALSPSQTFFATSGIRRTVSNAHKEASSMLMASALLLVLNATPLTKPQETA